LSIKQHKPSVFHIVGSIDSYNGASLQAINLAQLLSNISKPIIISSAKINWLKKSKRNSIDYLQIPNNGFKRQLCILLAFLIYRPKIVHIHGFWIGFDILFLAWLCQIKTILKTTLLGVDDIHTIKKASRHKAWIAMRCTVCNSLVETIATINRGYLSAHKVICIPNFVKHPEKAIPLKEKTNLTLVIGSVIKRKSVDKAIKLFLENIVEYESDRLIIIGSTKSNISYYNYCQSIIPDNKRQHISFIGQISQVELQPYLHKAKAIIQLSEQEGLPNAVLEAMAYNCVPILSPLEGIAKDVIPNEKFGIILNKKTKMNWKHFDELITSCDIFNRVESHYSGIVMINRYAELYKTLA